MENTCLVTLQSLSVKKAVAHTITTRYLQNEVKNDGIISLLL